MTDVLLVVDVQNDFIDGSLGTKEAPKIINNVVNVIDYMYKSANANNNERKLKVIATRDSHNKDTYLNTPEGKNLQVLHCIEGTHGWEIREEVAKKLSEVNATIINKHAFGLDIEVLKELFEKIINDKIDTVYVIGLCTDICVLTNVMLIKQLYPEIKIVVIENCCAGVTITKHHAAIEAMKSCQVSIMTYGKKEKTETSYWTVDTLISKLQHLSDDGNGDKIIVVAEDDEGNGYRPLPRQQILSTREEIEEYVDEDDLSIDINSAIIV